MKEFEEQLRPLMWREVADYRLRDHRTKYYVTVSAVQRKWRDKFVALYASLARAEARDILHSICFFVPSQGGSPETHAAQLTTAQNMNSRQWIVFLFHHKAASEAQRTRTKLRPACIRKCCRRRYIFHIETTMRDFWSFDLPPFSYTAYVPLWTYIAAMTSYEHCDEHLP